MLTSKNIDLKTIILPGDVMLGLLSLNGVSKPTPSMAIVSSLNDYGPKELLVLSNKEKANIVFSQGTQSFIDVIEENYSGNIFFVFKSRMHAIEFNNVSAITHEPLRSGYYINFWSPKPDIGIKKNAWPLSIYDKGGKESIGNFVAIDIIRENGMVDMLYKIKRDGK